MWINHTEAIGESTFNHFLTARKRKNKMAQYFRQIPLWVIGTAKIIRDVLIAVSAVSTLTDPRYTLAFLIVREAVGKFVQYSERETKAKA